MKNYLVFIINCFGLIILTALNFSCKPDHSKEMSREEIAQVRGSVTRLATRVAKDVTGNSPSALAKSF